MKQQFMTMSVLPAALALAAFAIGLPPAQAEDADSGASATTRGPAPAQAEDAVEFKKFCNAAAASGSLLEKEKFLAWCEAEANSIAASEAQTGTQPPGPETGSSTRYDATIGSVVLGWQELDKRFNPHKASSLLPGVPANLKAPSLLPGAPAPYKAPNLLPGASAP